MNTRALRYGGKGLGSIFDPSTPIVLPTTSTSTSTSAASIFDKINAGVNAAANTVNTVQKTISSFNPGSSTPSSQPAGTPVVVNSSMPGYTPTPQRLFSSPLSTGAKVALGVGGAAILGTIVYFVAKKNKKE